LRLRRETKILKAKALASLRRAAQAFNSFEDDGRTTAVLLHQQHSFEMLMKAALVQRRVQVFAPALGLAVGFEKCVNLGRQHLGLTEAEAGTLRAIDALRDQEQHWMAAASEGILYTHSRAAVTLFDDLMKRWFGERLAAHLPARVLPISAELPRDIQLLIDEEFTQIRAFLQPGRRRRPEARARIRALLALEAHVTEGVLVATRDVARVEKGIQSGTDREHVFPRLSELTSEVVGEGINVGVRFSKTAGPPVRFVSADAEGDAAAVREVDLQRKYHCSKPDLAKKLSLTMPRCYALRLHLGIEDDESCRHDFVFGSTVHRQYSDNALTKMRSALETLDIEEIWSTYREGVSG
jgi:hypothetical protein